MLPGRGVRLALSGFCPQLACDLEQLYQVTKWGVVTGLCEVLPVLDLVDRGLAHMYTRTHVHTLTCSAYLGKFCLFSFLFVQQLLSRGEKALASSRPGVARAVVERAAAMSHGLPSHAPQPCTLPSEALSIVSHSVQASAAVQIPWIDEITLPHPPNNLCIRPLAKVSFLPDG